MSIYWTNFLGHIVNFAPVTTALIAVVISILAIPTLSYAAKSNDEQMLSLDPQTRIEQRCDARAMGVIGREHHTFKPDEFVAYAFADPVIHGHAIVATGGAIRSHGAWYHVAYHCDTSDNGLRVQSFNYTLGGMVPRQQWADHYLVPQ